MDRMEARIASNEEAVAFLDAVRAAYDAAGEDPNPIPAELLAEEER